MKNVFYFLLVVPLLFGMASCSSNDNDIVYNPENCPHKDYIYDPDAIVGEYSSLYALAINGNNVTLSQHYGQVHITQNSINDEISIYCATSTPISLYTLNVARNVMNAIKVCNIKLTGADGDRALSFEGIGSIYLENNLETLVPATVTGTIKKYPETRSCMGELPQSTFQELDMVISMQFDMLDMNGVAAAYDVVFTIIPIAS